MYICIYYTVCGRILSSWLIFFPWSLKIPVASRQPVADLPLIARGGHVGPGGSKRPQKWRFQCPYAPCIEALPTKLGQLWAKCSCYSKICHTWSLWDGEHDENPMDFGLIFRLFVERRWPWWLTMTIKICGSRVSKKSILLDYTKPQ